MPLRAQMLMNAQSYRMQETQNASRERCRIDGYFRRNRRAGVVVEIDPAHRSEHQQFVGSQRCG